MATKKTNEKIAAVELINSMWELLTESSFNERISNKFDEFANVFYEEKEVDFEKCVFCGADVLSECAENYNGGKACEDCVEDQEFEG